MSTLNGRCCWIKHRYRKWKIRAGALSAQGQRSTLQLWATGESYEALAHTSYKDQEKITLLQGLPALKTCPLTTREHYNTRCCSTLQWQRGYRPHSLLVHKMYTIQLKPVSLSVFNLAGEPSGRPRYFPDQLQLLGFFLNFDNSWNLFLENLMEIFNQE